MKFCTTKPKQKSVSSAIIFAAGFISALSVTVISGAFLTGAALNANIFGYESEESTSYSESTSSEGDDAIEAEFEADAEEYQALDDIEDYEEEIADIEKDESELLNKLLTQDPNGYDYWNLRNRLTEIKAKKEKLRQMKKSVQTELKQGKMEILEKKQEAIQTQINSRKEIFEKCRQLGATDFANCLRAKLGKPEMPKPAPMSGTFEKPWGRQQNQEGKQGMLPPAAQMNQPNTNQPSLKSIVWSCKEGNQEDLSECIKQGVEKMKENILREAEKRIEMLQKEAEAFHESASDTDGSFPTFSPRPFEAPKMQYQQFYPTERGFIQASPQPNHLPYATPATTGGQKTEQEWREYNRKFNSKPTI